MSARTVQSFVRPSNELPRLEGGGGGGFRVCLFFWRGTHSVFQWHSGGVLLDIFRLRKPENENWDPTYLLCLKGFSAGVHGLLGFGGLGFRVWEDQGFGV